MLKTPIAAAVLAALSFGFVASANADTTPATNGQGGAIQGAVAQSSSQDTQSTSSDSSSSSTTDTKTKNLDTVVVSGSLINNAQIQTATPTYTVTAQDIKARGFNSVNEVLQSAVQSNGYTQGQQQSGGFTQGAQAISMYGLPPEFTLLLLDGKPITNFGQLYNGTSNFTNISNIPISMVDHIDIIPGGGSSIYGSSAIAGVVNIVTKQHMDGGEIDVRTGNYSGGGGANQRINAAWGHQFGKLDVLTAFEFDNSSPLWGYQRHLTDGTLGDPAGTTPYPVTGIENYGTIGNEAPSQIGWISPPTGCGAISGLFNGSTRLTNSTVPTSPGQYCGSPQVNGYTTFINQNRSYDGMLKLRYDVNDNLRLYADMLVDWQQQKWLPGANFIWWTPNNLGPVGDQYGNLVMPTHWFAPEEIPGGFTSQMETQDDLMYQGDIGANGHFGDSGWDWDVYFMRSGDRTSLDQPERNNSAVNNYFEQFFQPTGTPGVYNINYAGFFSPISPATFASFAENLNSVTNTWVNNTRFTVTNSSLFSLPGGDAGIAILAEGGSEAWYEPASPALVNGDIWGLTGSSGGGQRSHKGAAFEFNAPILKQLTLDLSGRYDYYSIPAGTSNNKFTYKIGLEYRPFDTLLLRGNYSTAFRAPDMSALYLGPSGFYESAQDPYLCAIAHSNNCGSPAFLTEFEGSNLSNPNLKPTTATSWTVGFVWAPITNLSWSVDFLHIDVTNEIAQQDITTLLAIDSQCLLGQQDPNSLLCQKTEGQVTRNSAGTITNVNSYFENISSEDTKSITTQLKYVFPTTPVGTFSTELDYNDMLKHSYVIYPGSPPINELTNLFYSSQFKDVTTADFSWNYGKWNSTIYVHRDSSAPNYIGFDEGANLPGAAWLGKWTTVNFSVGYSPVKNLDLSLMINNVFNTMPPTDKTDTVYPYFDSTFYNVYGREIMLQAAFRFGGSTK
jgi:iron complex outermembrane recepter protein